MMLYGIILYVQDNMGVLTWVYTFMLRWWLHHSRLWPTYQTLHWCYWFTGDRTWLLSQNGEVTVCVRLRCLKGGINIGHGPTIMQPWGGWSADIVFCGFWIFQIDMGRGYGLNFGRGVAESGRIQNSVPPYVLCWPDNFDSEVVSVIPLRNLWVRDIPWSAVGDNKGKLAIVSYG